MEKSGGRGGDVCSIIYNSIDCYQMTETAIPHEHCPPAPTTA